MPSGPHSQASLSPAAVTVTEQTRPSTLFPRAPTRARRPSRQARGPCCRRPRDASARLPSAGLPGATAIVAPDAVRGRCAGSNAAVSARFAAQRWFWQRRGSAVLVRGSAVVLVTQRFMTYSDDHRFSSFLSTLMSHSHDHLHDHLNVAGVELRSERRHGAGAGRHQSERP